MQDPKTQQSVALFNGMLEKLCSDETEICNLINRRKQKHARMSENETL